MLIWILCALLTATCWCQALGAWKLVPSKSRLGSSATKAITAQYEAHSEAEVWTFHQLRTDGALETTSQTLHFDGKEYPCGDIGLEERPDTMVSRKLDARRAEVSYKKAGRVTRRVVRTVSADGKQMTLEIRITPEKGMATELLMVFAK